MHELTLLVSNRLGLHARAAAKLVQTASQFDARILIRFRSREINAKSIMGVMMLAACQGSELHISAEGNDAEQALAAISDLFERRFDEES